MSRDLFESALNAEGVTGKLADLARSIYFQESGGGRNTQTSNAGARGGMQIIPSTFQSVADKGWNIDDPVQNARAGIRYLKVLDKQAGGDPALTAAGYYGGPGGLEKARRGIAVSDPRNPHAPNTLEYGRQVVARMPEAHRPVVSQIPETGGRPIATRDASIPEIATAPSTAVAEAAVAPVPQGPDPWAAFLQTMQTNRPVQVADIDYSNPRPAMHVSPMQVTPMVPGKVNFDAFAGWKGWA